MQQFTNIVKTKLKAIAVSKKLLHNNPLFALIEVLDVVSHVFADADDFAKLLIFNSVT